MARKKKKASTARLSIAKKILADLAAIQKRNVVHLEEIKKARARAEELEATISSDPELSRLDPLHAIYVYAHNKLDVLIEQLSDLPPCSQLVSAWAKANDLYMPSYPPMSPITTSYFACWGMFDLRVGVGKESFGDVAIAVSKALKVDPALIAIFEKMQESRMGLYIHEGTSGKYIQLKEFVTHQEMRCFAPSGYIGYAGELWLARVLPEPYPESPFGYSVVFTTPYIIGQVKDGYFRNIGDISGWESFFDRTLEKTGASDEITAYETLMKYGLSRNYWNEYIFQAYANYTDHAVFLTGLPDVPSSLPHSPEYSQKG